MYFSYGMVYAASANCSRSIFQLPVVKTQLSLLVWLVFVEKDRLPFSCLYFVTKRCIALDTSEYELEKEIFDFTIRTPTI